jgi:hypothetical protein
MPKIAYVNKRFTPESLAVIAKANEIIEAYQAQGFDLTLRQTYYQFVARGWIPNKDSEYKRLGNIIADGRLAGLIDWEAITDRTRNLRQNSHWDSPGDIMDSAAASFAYDKWADQKYRIECWIEKDALVGILESACEPLDVPYFSCRGYTSISEVWSAAMRLKAWRRKGQRILILHLGDHDPSGIDMSRDIVDRIGIFGVKVEFKRLALNMDQVQQYNPPPNPAKSTDARYKHYRATHGDESWELDALDPVVLKALIRDNIVAHRDQAAWEAAVAREVAAKARLRKAARNWDAIVGTLDEYEDEEEDQDGEDEEEEA